MNTSTSLLSFTELQNAYPNGVFSARHGCYYFLDQDSDLAYFIQYIDGTFEPEVQYVDIDTLAEDEVKECKLIAAHIAIYS